MISRLPVKYTYSVNRPYRHIHDSLQSLPVPKHNIMKKYMEHGDKATHILDHRNKWRWLVSSTIRLLYPRGKGPWYPFRFYMARRKYMGRKHYPLSGVLIYIKVCSHVKRENLLRVNRSSLNFFFTSWNLGSSVSKVTVWWILFSAGTEFSLRHNCVKITSAARPASYSTGTEPCLSGNKANRPL
jgi:hypothetical protein